MPSEIFVKHRPRPDDDHAIMGHADPVRSDHAPDADPLPPISPAGTKREAFEAIGQVLTRASELEREPAPRRHFRIKGILAVALSVFMTYLWFGNPSWLPRFGEPDPPREFQDASVRFAMYLQAQRIEQFRLRTGRLPRNLEEAGPIVELLHYERDGSGGFRLVTNYGGAHLVLKSSDPVESFLGDLEPLGLARTR